MLTTGLRGPVAKLNSKYDSGKDPVMNFDLGHVAKNMLIEKVSFFICEITLL